MSTYCSSDCISSIQEYCRELDIVLYMIYDIDDSVYYFLLERKCENINTQIRYSCKISPKIMSQQDVDIIITNIIIDLTNRLRKRSDFMLSLEDTLEKIKSKDWYDRYIAFRACEGRTDISDDVLINGTYDEDMNVRYAAFTACRGRKGIPFKVLEKGIEDNKSYIREAAFYACQGRIDIPMKYIEKGVKDNDPWVRGRALALKAEREE